MIGKVVSLNKHSPSVDPAAPSVDIERVLEISAKQFAEQGFDGVSMREISRECGCPVASIYYHFASKADLYKEAHANKVELSTDLVNARLASITDKSQRFDVLIEAFHELFTGDRTLLLLTERDVIDAAVSGRQFLSRRQFNYFNVLLRQVGGEALGKPISAETGINIAALVFGLCGLSLVIHKVEDQSTSEAVHAERAGLVRAARAIVGI